MLMRSWLKWVLNRCQSRRVWHDRASRQRLMGAWQELGVANVSVFSGLERLEDRALLAPTPLITFEGINFDENASNTGFYNIPPDPSGAAGPNHVVSVVNKSIEWHTTSGTQQNSQSLSSFFAPLLPVNGTFDPKVIYDSFADRFLVVTLEQVDSGAASPSASNTSRFLIAVSDDSNPNGTWTYQAFDSKITIGGIERWFDYPGFAVDEEAIYLTGNMFSFNADGTSFGGTLLWIIGKTTGTGGGVYGGGTSSFSITDVGAIPGAFAVTTQPAMVYGTTPGSVGTWLTQYSGISDGTNEFVNIIRVDDPLGTPTFNMQQVAVGNIDNASLAMPDAPQLGTATEIETNDRRALNAVWRNNALWTTATVVPVSGADAGQATAHWWKFNTTNLPSVSLADQGNVGGEDIATGAFTYMPSLAVDASGNMAIGFSASAGTIYAGSYYSGRRSTDVAGTVQSSYAFAPGQDYYVRTFGGPRNRWGDYSGTVVDPNGNFWVFNEYAMTRGTPASGEDGRWATRWAEFNFASISVALDGSNNLVITDTDGAGRNNSLTISNDGSGNLVITDAAEQFVSTGGISGASLSNGNRTLTVPFSSITGSEVLINGGVGNDTVTVSLATSLGKTLTFNGGAGGSDKLAISGGSTTSQTFHFTNENDGSVVLAGTLAGTINYSGLEPISSSLIAAEVILNYSTSTEVITVSQDGTDNTLTKVDSNVAGESVSFVNPTASLQINGGDSGNDTITVSGFGTSGGGFSASLTINGGTGNDTVNLNADITFASGRSLDVDLQNDDASPGVDTITVGTNANLVLAGTGTATLVASRNISMASGSSITTVNGGITLSANSAGTTTGNFIGIEASNALLQTSGTGNISLTGKGANNSNANAQQYGVYLNSGTSVVSTATGATAGTITLNGTGGTGTSQNHGVYLLGSTTDVTSVDGDIAITGTGGDGSTSDNYGVFLSGIETMASTGTGTNAATITINGTSGDGTTNNFGVFLSGNTTDVTSNDGNISITGTAIGSSSGNVGVQMSNIETVRSNGTGANAATISITGNGADGTSSNYGVWLSGGTTDVTSVDGNVSITGTAGDGSAGNNYGVYLNSIDTVASTGTTTEAATITITGTGGAGTGSNYGVLGSGTTTIVTSVIGAILIDGTGKGTADNNHGVLLDGIGAVTSTGTGVNAATISIQGTGANGGGSNVGVYLNNNTTDVTSQNGDISITGTGGLGTGGGNSGLIVSNGATVNSTGAGANAADITITGTGGKGSGLRGAQFDGGVTAVTTVDGDIAITGTITGPATSNDNFGVYLNSIDGIHSTGTGASAGTITIQGTAGNGSNNNRGVYLTGSTTDVTSVDGTISITGAGGATATGNDNYGIEIANDAIVQTTTATLSVTGTGGNGNSYGVRLSESSGGRLLSIGSGSIIVTADGNGTQVDLIAGSDSIMGGPSATGPISLNANSINLSGASVSVQTSGTVTIKQRTATTAINVGSAVDTTASTLELSDTELDRITAATVQIGDANSDTITVSAAITHGNNLSLTTGAGVTFNNSVTMSADKSLTVSALGTSTGTIGLAVAAADLSSSGSGVISLTTVRDISLVSGSSIATANGDITLSANSAGTTAGNFVGININSGSLSTSGTGNISATGRAGDSTAGGQHGVLVQGASAAITATGAGSISLTGTGGGGASGTNNDGFRFAGGAITSGTTGDVTITGTKGTNGNSEGVAFLVTNPTSINTSTSTGTLTVISNTFDFSSSVNFSINAAGQTVVLRQSTNDTALNLGTNSTTTWGLGDAQLDRIAARTLRIGDANSGAITVSADIDFTDGPVVDRLHLFTGSSVTATEGGVLVYELAITAGGGVVFADVSTNVTNLGIAAGDNVQFRESNGLIVASVEGVNGVSTSSGFVTLQVDSGNLTSSSNISATQDVELTVIGAEALFTLSSGASITGGPQFYTSDKMDIQGLITSSGWCVLRPNQGGNGVYLGATGDSTANTLELSDAELDRITASSLLIGNNSGIMVTQPISPSGSSTMVLGSSGGVTEDTGATVTIANLEISAASVVSMYGANDVDSVVVTTTGGIVFRDSDGVNVGNVAAFLGPVGLVTLSGDIVLVAGGPVTVVRPIETDNGGFGLHLLADDALIQVNSTLAATTAGFIRADKIAINAAISVPTGRVDLFPEATADPNDAIVVGSSSDAATDTLELSDAELDLITAMTIGVGSNVYAIGPINVTSAIAPDNSTNMVLFNTGGLSGIAFATGGSVTVTGEVSLSTNSTITADATGVDVSSASLSIVSGDDVGTLSNPLRMATGSLGILNAFSIDLFLNEADTLNWNAAGSGFDGNNSTAHLLGGTFGFNANNLVSDTNSVSVEGGILAVGAFSDTIGTLIVRSGSVTGSTGVLTSSNTMQTESGLISAILAGSNGLTQSTGGTTTLSAANSYTGATIINGGTLLVNGSTAAGSPVTVNSGGTLGGSGSVNGSVTVASGGHLAPGISPEILDSGSVTFSAGANFDVEINGTTVGSQYDQLNVTGTVTLNDANLVVTLGYAPANGDSFVIINNDDTDAVTGLETFKVGGVSIPDGGAFYAGGNRFVIDYTSGSNSNDVTLTVQNFTTEVKLDSGNLVITDIAIGGQSDTLTIQSDTTDGNPANHKFVISDPNRILGITGTITGAIISSDSHTITVPFSSVTGNVLINTLAGNDSLTVDFSLGNFSKSVTYDGGNPTSGPGDSLTLTGGGPFASVAHAFTDASSGLIAITGNSTISYTGLEPITDNVSAIDRVFNFTAAAETITVTDGTISDGKTNIDSDLTEAVYFVNPTNSLTINAGSGDDTVTVTSVDGGGLTINGDAGTDSVNFNGFLSLGINRSLAVNAEAVEMGAGSDVTVWGTGAVDLTADDITIDAASTLNVEGTMTLRPQTISRPIDLGTKTSSSLSLTDDELDRIFAGTLSIQNQFDPSTAPIAISQAISLANVTLLQLWSRSTVTQASGATVSVAQFAVNASGAVILGEANDVDTLAINTLNGNVTFVDADGFTIDSLFLSSGVRTNGGHVSLTATTGSITVANPIGTADLEATGTITVAVLGDEGTFTLADGATVEADAGMTVTADNIILLGSLGATGSTVTLRPAASGDAIDLGSMSDAVANTLELSDAELDRITASRIVVGSSMAGAVTFSAPISMANSNVLDVITGGTVNDIDSSVVFTNGGLSLNAAQGIGGINSRLNVAVSQLAATAAAGGVFLHNAADLELTTVGSVSGLTATGSSIGVIAVGNLTVNQAVTAGNGFDLVAAGDERTLSINAAVAAGGNVGSGLTGDKLVINTVSGSINVNTGGVSFGPYIVGDADAVNLGSAADTTPNTLEISDAELDRVTAGLITVGGSDAGSITVSDAISPSSGTFIIRTGNNNSITFSGATASVNVGSGHLLISLSNSGSGSVLSGAALTDVIANNLTISGGGGGIGTSGNPLTINVNTLSTDTDGTSDGPQYLSEANSLSVSNSDLDAGTATITLVSGTFVTTAAGSILSPVSVSSGATLGGTGTVSAPVSVASGGTVAPGTSSGILNSGSVTFANGANFDVEINGTTVGSEYDQLRIDGTSQTVILGNATLDITLGYTAANGDSFTIIDNVDASSTISGLFEDALNNPIPDDSTIVVSGQNFVVNYNGGIDGNDVVLTAVASFTTELTLDGISNLVITDIASGGQADLLTIKSDTTDANPANHKFVISDPNRLLGTTIVGATGSGSHTVTIPISAVTGTQIYVNTLGGNDSLTVDYSLGNFSKTVNYDGGNPTNGPGDSLTLTGGTFMSVAHYFTDSSSGSIAFSGDNSPITYTGLEPITDNLSVTHRSFIFLGGDETVTVTDGTASDGKTFIDSDRGESVYFTNPTVSLLILPGTGADTVRLRGVDGSFEGSLSIDTADGADVVVFESNGTTLAHATLFVTAETINVNAPIVTNGGDVILTATGNVTLADSISTSGGSVTLTADSDGDGFGTLTLLAAGSFSEQAKLTASDAAASDFFGYSVAVSGNTAVVGGWGDDDNGSASGSAYVFVRSGNVWTQQAKLTPADGATDDNFGTSVAISGDTVIVGAEADDGVGLDSGSAYVFTRSGSVWTQQAKLTASDAAAGDVFGFSVSLSGDTATVGSPFDDDAGGSSGSVYVFTRNGTLWTQQAKLTASDAASADLFGSAISVDGNAVIVGARGDDDGGNASGSAYVFTRSGVAWSQQAKLTAADAASQDLFGYSVSLSGETAIVGARKSGGIGSDPGAAYVFTRSGIVWSQQAKLTAADTAGSDIFGYSVAVSGDTAIVGAYANGDAGSESGSAYVFSRSGSVWTEQQKLTATDAAAGDQFGYSVAINGETLVVGASGDDTSASDTGSAYLLQSGVATPGGVILAGGGTVSLSSSGKIGASGAAASVTAAALSTSTAATNEDQFLSTPSSVTVGGNDLNAGTGTITLSGGTFLTTATGSILSPVIIASGATLGGTGITGTITTQSGSSIAPGTSPGILNSGNVTLVTGSAFDVEIGGTTPGNTTTDHDQLNVTGTVSLGGATLTISSFNGFTPATGQTFTIINNDDGDAVSGMFAGLSEGAGIANFLGSGLKAQVSYQGGSGNDVILTLPEVTVTVSPASVTEDSGLGLAYTFTRTGSTAAALTVNFNVTGLAIYSTDYAQSGAASFSSSSGTVTIPAGSANVVVTLTPEIDQIVENHETAILTISSGTNYNIGSTDSATGTINNDDTATLSISAPSITETDADQTVTFTVTLDKAVEGGFALALSASDISTEGTADFTLDTTGLNFTGDVGETKSVIVTIKGDDIVEAHEQFSVTLGDVTGTTAVQDAAITTGASATGTINNDDTATLSISAPSITETDADQTVTFTVTLDKAVEGGFALALSASDISTEGAVDFTLDTTSLNFAGNVNETKTVMVTVKGDDTVEAHEQFSVTLGDVTGTTVIQDAAITTGASATGMINNDDTATLSISAPSITETDADQTVTFTVTLDKAVEGGFLLALNASDISTEGAADFTLDTTSLIFTGNVNETKSVIVTVKGDDLDEGNEQFSVTLGDVTGTSAVQDAAITTGASATATIIDDDGVAPVNAELAVAATSAEKPEGNSGTTSFTFTVTRSVNTTGATSVSYTVSGSGANPANADDFGGSFPAGVVNFSDGQSTQTITVLVSGDLIIEPNETFRVTLSSPSGSAVITTETADGTIQDDDSGRSVGLTAGGTLVVSDPTGTRADRLTVKFDLATNSLIISDSVNTLTSGVGTQLTAKSVQVPMSTITGQVLLVNLGGGNDFADLSTVPASIDVQVNGGEGADTIFASAGGDLINAGGGYDSIRGGLGNDTVNAGEGNDTVNAGAGNDNVDGGTGANLLNGEAGNDTLTGGTDKDSLNGGDDDDTLLGNGGDDSLNGGNGNDLLDGGDNNDLLKGGNGDDRLLGRAGNDQLNGDSNNDTISGGLGNDSLNGFAGNDVLAGEQGADTVIGGTGTDKLTAGSGSSLTDDPLDQINDVSDTAAEKFASLILVFSDATKLFTVLGA